MPKKILLADDSITIQKVISITLASEDCELEIVGEGNAAITKIKAMKPDLVLADIAMPGKTGYEVCNFIKSDPNLKNIPVILLAGTFEPLNKAEAQRVKADDSIVKPFGSQEFVDKIKALIAKAEAPPVKEAAPEVPEVKTEVTAEVWKSVEFLGALDEPEGAGLQEEPDMGFLEGSLIDEGGKDLGGAPQEEEFTDLSFEEPKKKAAPPPAQPPPPAQKRPTAPPVPPAVPPAYVPPPAPPPPPPPQPFDFDAFKAESFAPPEEEPVQDYWSQPDAGISPEAPAPPPPPAYVPPPPMAAAPPPPPPPRVEPPPARPAAPPPPPQMAYEPPAAAAEEPSPFFEVPTPAPPAGAVVERVAKAAEQRVVEESTRAAGIGLAVSRDQIEDVVRKIAREIIEEVAWEVVPELTEQIVVEEFGKFREVFLKVKRH